MRVPKLCVCFLVTLIFFSGCSGKETKQETQDAFKKTTTEMINDTTLDLCMIQADTLNPLRTTVRHNAEVLSLLYDSLFVLTDENEAVPDLCTKLSQSEDGRLVTLLIRENVFFHDGTRLLARDVASSINFILSSDGFYKERLSCVDMAQTNGKKIELFLNQKTENISCLLDFPILPETYLEKVEESTVLESPSLGSGLYFLKGYQINKCISLAVNKTHHSGSVPVYDTINIHLLPDEQTAIYMLENRALDALSESALEQMVYTPPKQILSASFPTDRLVFLGVKEAFARSFSKDIKSLISRWIEEENIGKLAEEINPAEEWTQYDGERITLLYCLDSFEQTRTAQKILRESEESGTFVMGDGVDKNTYISRIQNGRYDLFLGETDLLPNEGENDFFALQKENSPAGMTGLFFENEMFYFHDGVEMKMIKTKNPYLYFMGRN